MYKVSEALPLRSTWRLPRRMMARTVSYAAILAAAGMVDTLPIMAPFIGGLGELRAKATLGAFWCLAGLLWWTGFVATGIAIGAQRTTGKMRSLPAAVFSFGFPRQWLQFGAITAATLYLAFLGTKTYTQTRNRVDLLGSLDPGAPIYARVTAARARGGGTAGLAVLGEYLKSRPRRSRLPDWQLWIEGPARSASVAEDFRKGDPGASCLGPSFHWHPGETINWSPPTPPMLLFCLQRQAFLIDVAADPDSTLEELNAAWNFVQEWRRANSVFPNLHPYAWSDDPTANRIQGQMALAAARRQRQASTVEDELALLGSVLQHAKRLMDESAHNYRTNHGLMQNCALLSIALEYSEFDRDHQWLKTAIGRMERHLRETVSPEGVFLELTPSYHLLATGLNLWFITACREAHIPLDPWLETRVRGMLAFARSILQPDRSFPSIADTPLNAPDTTGWPWDNLPPWPEVADLRRAFSPVRDALPNSPAAELWGSSGYFVLREPAPAWDRNNALMATMIGGPRTLAHQHFNALSLTLYAHGLPLLAGPGYPDYGDEKRREAMIATTSQNTVSVDGRSQQPGAASIRHFESGSFENPKQSSAVFQAESNLYPGVLHRRSLYYGPATAAILVVDELTSDGLHIYRQHFRAAPGVLVRGAPGLIELRESGAAERSLMQIHTWLLTDQGVSAPPAQIEAPMASFAIFARHVTFISVLDCGPPQGSPRIVPSRARITWEGDQGILHIDLPTKSEGMDFKPKVH